MPASRQVSFNAKLEYMPSASWVELGEIIDSMGPDHKRKVIGLPALRNSVQRKKPGRADSGDVTLTIGYDGTNYALWLAIFKANASKPFRLTMPEGSTDAFTAFVTAVGKKIPDDEQIVFTVTLSVDGDNTFTDGN